MIEAFIRELSAKSGEWIGNVVATWNSVSESIWIVGIKHSKRNPAIDTIINEVLKTIIHTEPCVWNNGILSYKQDIYDYVHVLLGYVLSCVLWSMKKAIKIFKLVVLLFFLSSFLVKYQKKKYFLEKIK